MIQLIENIATMTGDYDGDELIVQSTIAETEIVTGVSATKVPSKTLWAGGTMTYTVTIVNDTDVPFTTPVFTDEIDARLTVVPDSVTVGGNPRSYTYLSNLLTVNLDTIPPNESLIVTFDVSIV